MILILTNTADRTADIVAAKLADRGAAVLRFDNASFPVDAAISFEYDGAGRFQRRLVTPTGVLDLDEIRAAWDRRPDRPRPHAHITRAMTRQFVQRECDHYIDDLWASLPCAWLPAPRAVVLRGQHKLSQMIVAQRLGFQLPPTLVGNDPAEVRDFVLRHRGAVISKVFYIPSARPNAANGERMGFRRMTERVPNRALAALGSVASCPTIFQAYVEKRVELRVTVVGDQVFAAEIDSQSNARTTVDWRRSDPTRTPYRIHDLPETERRRCLALNAAMGLRYSTIDLIVTPAGEIVFLEINPNGQYGWVEAMTGMPISDAICDELMDSKRLRLVA